VPALARSSVATGTMNSTQTDVMNDLPNQLAEAQSMTDKDRSIVLIGLMGAGKSSVGRRLAARLGLPFVDADNEIEAAAGCSVPEIFALHGEAAFRDGERRVIARLLDGPRQVVATGGGAILDADTRDKIRARGISIWLRADLDILVRRCQKRGNRPLLQQGDMRQVLQRLIEERTPYYAEADLAVDSGDGPHEQVVDAIVAGLRRRSDLARAAHR